MSKGGGGVLSSKIQFLSLLSRIASWLRAPRRDDDISIVPKPPANDPNALEARLGRTGGRGAGADGTGEGIDASLAARECPEVPGVEVIGLGPIRDWRDLGCEE